MQVSELEHFRDLLIERQQHIKDWLNKASPVHESDIDKIKSLMGEITNALEKIKQDSFGDCDVCHGEIEKYRLEIQPVTQICLDCISKEEKTVLEEDLFLASKVHRALLPQEIPKIEGYDLSVRSLAARSIGGDYYDFLNSPDRNAPRIVIADTMGKGLPAGLLMSNFQGILRILSSEIPSLSELVTKSNQWICRNIPVTKFISLFCFSLETTDTEKTIFRYVNAGHCPPIIRRKDGTVEWLKVTGGVLGVHDQFEYDELECSLYPGDYILLYTDGVTEAMNKDEEFYEEDRLCDFVCNHKSSRLEDIIDDLITDIQNFSGSQQFQDDITTIILKKN